jgi:hypothetical protein
MARVYLLAPSRATSGQTGHHMSQSPYMLSFVLIADLPGYFFNPLKPDGIRFKSPAPYAADLSLKPAKQNDKLGLSRRLECCSCADTPASEEEWRFVSSLLQGKFTPFDGAPIRLPNLVSGEERIDHAGNIHKGYLLPIKYFPPGLQTICVNMRQQLEGAVLRFIRLLRWQQQIDGPHSIFDHAPPLYWRVGNDGNYHVIKDHKSIPFVQTLAGIQWSQEDEADFQRLWAQPHSLEPLAHELLREANALLVESPRSALLTLVSAIETGVKTHVSKVAPDTSWLMFELPSPPIHKILRQYIPELHSSRGHDMSYWRKLRPHFKLIEKAATLRNTLTHTGAMPLEVVEILPKFFEAVSDVLYVLDVLEGHDWAKENVSHETRKMLNWPSPRRNRITARSVPSVE